MNTFTIDFETFYGDEFTLSKLTTEAYVRDPRFEPILCGVKRNAEPAYWVDASDIRSHLGKLELHKHAVLAHHAHFDGLILSHHYGITPKVWFDTLAMARALHGVNGGLSLAKLAERYGVGAKGTEVINAKGKRRGDFSAHDLRRYGAYCEQDCNLEYRLFSIMVGQFGKGELQLIDLTTRMFTEPVLDIDAELLTKYIAAIKSDKLALLLEAGIQLADVMSNDKFAAALQQIGVVPPRKISLTTGKETWAFAKTDPGMEALAEHPDEVVQVLVAARLKNKTTINETRAQRMVDMIGRGPAPVYLKYYGASTTGRASGGDKMNWQNFGRGGRLRKAVRAPLGHSVVVGDSSNIEARVLDVLAGQEDAVQVYRDNDAGIGPDTYCVLAGKIYHRTVTKADKDERQLGKVAKLGLGYGMGTDKFIAAVRAMAKMVISQPVSAQVVSVYRNSHAAVTTLWKRAENALEWIQKGIEGKPIDPKGVLLTCKEGILLPNGMKIRYPELQFRPKKFGVDDPLSGWSFWNGKAREKIYGGKIVENCLAAGTLVLTDRGWVPIEKVTPRDRVHDGDRFVPHGGKVYKSVQPCVIVDGVYMTTDHKVLTDDGWKKASQLPRPYRPSVRSVDRLAAVTHKREEMELAVSMRVRKNYHEGRSGRNKRTGSWRKAQLWVLDTIANWGKKFHARYEQAPRVRSLAEYAGSVPAGFTQSVEKLRRAGYNRVSMVADQFLELLGRHGADISSWTILGSYRQQRTVQYAELSLDRPTYTSTEQAQQLNARCTCAVADAGDKPFYTVLSIEARLAAGGAGAPAVARKQVYDIINAGRRQRFVVLGENGPFIVHNCTQALARIIVMDQTLLIAKQFKRWQALRPDAIYKVVLSVHDEAVGVTPTEDAVEALEYMNWALRQPPAWMPELPLFSEGGIGDRYGDAK